MKPKIFVFAVFLLVAGFVHRANAQVLSYDLVVSQIVSNGGALIGNSAVPHNFNGFEIFETYQMPDQSVVRVFGWNSVSNENYTFATTICTQVYRDNGDCNGKGGSCDVTIENGITVITQCCA